MRRFAVNHSDMRQVRFESSAAGSYSVAEQYWFAALLVYTGAPLVMITNLAPPRGLGFGWDAAMALGIVAASGLALLPLLSARWWAPQFRSGGFLRLIQTVHRDLTYVALTLVAAHVLILLVLEPRVIEYLKLSATGPMLAGLVATLVGGLLVYTSLARERLRWTHRVWRAWHAAGSAFALGLIGWHLLGAGFYFRTRGTVVGLLWVLSVPTALTLYWRWRPLSARARAAPSSPVSRRSRAFPRHRRLVLAVALCWVAAALVYAWSRLEPNSLSDTSPCRVEPCL